MMENDTRNTIERVTAYLLLGAVIVFLAFMTDSAGADSPLIHTPEGNYAYRQDECRAIGKVFAEVSARKLTDKDMRTTFGNFIEENKIDESDNAAMASVLSVVRNVYEIPSLSDPASAYFFGFGWCMSLKSVLNDQTT